MKRLLLFLLLALSLLLYIEAVYGSTDTRYGSGDSHAGADTDPRLAWSEGWATHFANLARDTGEYYDSYGDGIGLAYDVASLPSSGEYAGRPGEGLDQNLSEWLIAASLWRLYAADSPSLGAERMMGTVRDWFDPHIDDRGARGADFVGFLDGYLCLQADVHRDLIASHIVGERTFPYDFGGSCPAGKPGRPVLTESVDVSRLPEPPGRIVFDSEGRRLREIRISR